MVHDTPLRNRHDAWAAAEAARTPDADQAAARPGAATGRRASAAVDWIPWGAGGDGAGACEVPASFGAIEAEYAAFRRGAALIDAPQRGTLRITGAERVAFLGRMLTQELRGLDAGCCRPAFWLSRQGRIAADLLLVETGSAMLVDLDRHDAAATVASISGYLFAEDVAIEDVSADRHRIAIHGPLAEGVLGTASGTPDLALAPGAAVTLAIAGAEVVAARRDLCGTPGIDLFLERDAAPAIWDALLATDEAFAGRRRVRPAGWFAFNVARIEGGSPLFHVDFGPTNLPHETGVLHDRVSFTKGCYLGQEIVARMESLGRPKQVLVGLLVEGERLPSAGDVIVPAGETGGTPIGVVTSSAPAPMLGARPVAFAMVKSAHAKPGTRLGMSAEGSMTEAVVAEGLRFAPEPGEAAP